MEFANLKAQYQAYKLEMDQAILQVVSSGRYIMGEEIQALEQGLSNFTEVKYSLACSSGTDALVMALMALGVGRGDEVITTPFTFIASAEAIALVGATPVFADIEEHTFNISPREIERRISNKTAAIIPVSLFGLPCDMDAINAIAKTGKISVIEDAAQSFGATYNGLRSCNLSELAATSFFPAKPLGCYGDGGAVFTCDAGLYEKLKSIRSHGELTRYNHHNLGINGRMDEIQAAILNVKLKYYGDEIEQRRHLARRYNALLRDLSGILLPMDNELITANSVFAQYTIRVKNRTNFIASLSQANIPTAVHYPIPLHLQPVFADLNLKAGEYPVAEKVCAEVVSLPMSAFLTEQEQNEILAAVKIASAQV